MISPTLSTFLLSIGGIILVDLILSGDNALVIGAAAAHIQQRRRRLIALGIGGLGAILLRILFTASTTFLLSIPFLQAVGGILVLVIAIRLLFDDQSSEETTAEDASTKPPDANEQLPALARRFSTWMGRRMEGKTTSANWEFFLAIAIITIADITMSLDNIIAIGALAHKQVVILVIGLSLSIALLILCSALVSELVSRIPWLIVVASFILAWVSSDLIWNDIHGWPFIQNNNNYLVGLRVACILIVLFALVIRLKRFRAKSHTTATPGVASTLEEKKEVRQGS